MEWNSFYSNACYECGNWGEGYPLRYCKNCRAVGFCERHSAVENTRHRDLCQILTQMRGQAPSLFALPNGQEPSQDAWMMMKTNLMLMAQLRLGRKLNKQEEEVLKFPRRCVLCYEVDEDKLADCKGCPGTSWCFRHMQSKEEHTERCRKLTECAASDVCCSPMLRGDIPDIPEDRSVTRLPQNMSEFIKICPTIVLFPYNVQTSASSEVFTRPLSLLYAMEKLDYEVKERLVVHVIGANAADLEDPSTFEIIFHFRPNLRELVLTFIGPDLEGCAPPLITPYLCKDCGKNEIKFDAKVLPLYYHDFAEGKEFTAPDIVIGYNVGVHECMEFGSDGDTWAPTIRTLGEMNCPLVLTAYTQEEAEKDHERILAGSDKFLPVLQERNPFASLRHYRDFESDDFYYQNQFIVIYKRSGEGEMLEAIKDMKLNDDDMICD